MDRIVGRARRLLAVAALAYSLPAALAQVGAPAAAVVSFAALSGCGEPFEGVANASPPSSLVITHGDVVDMIGDSNTYGFAGLPWYKGGWEASVLAGFTTQAPGTSHSTGGEGHATGTEGSTRACPNCPTIINRGHNSYSTSDLIAQYATDVAAFSPNVVVIEIGAADLVLVGRSVATFQSNLTTYVGMIQSGFPSAKIALANIWAVYEQCPDAYGPVTVPQYNAAIAAVATATNSFLIDFHTPAQAYECAHNLPLPGASSGILSPDGLHLSPALGCPLASQAAISGTTLVP